LARLEEVLAGDLAGFNAMLKKVDLPAVHP
jgi:hypothetical protein